MRITLNDMMSIQEEYNNMFNLLDNKTTTQILDSIDFNEIEKYVRDKKLKNLNEYNNK